MTTVSLIADTSAFARRCDRRKEFGTVKSISPSVPVMTTDPVTELHSALRMSARGNCCSIEAHYERYDSARKTMNGSTFWRGFVSTLSKYNISTSCL